MTASCRKGMCFICVQLENYNRKNSNLKRGTTSDSFSSFLPRKEEIQMKYQLKYFFFQKFPFPQKSTQRKHENILQFFESFFPLKYHFHTKRLYIIFLAHREKNLFQILWLHYYTLHLNKCISFPF